MATTYDKENTKLLRKAAKVGVRVLAGTTVLMNFDNSNLISVKLDLRGVETKLDNPDLQASTIEVQAYYDGDLSEFSQFQGRQTRIQYKSSYGSTLWQNDVASQYVGIRVFYMVFNRENVTLKNKILTIKGTDYTGVLVKQIWDMSNLNPSWTSVTYSGTSYYKFEDMAYAYIADCMPLSKMNAQTKNPFSGGTRGGTFYFDKSYNAYIYRQCLPEMSWRKRIAYLINVFRGSKTDPLLPRAVYRDAGCPYFNWFADPLNMTNGARVANIQSMDVANGKYNSIWTNKPWEINYNDVADFEIEYGNRIKKVYVDTPNVGKNSLEQKIYLRSNMSDIIEFDEPGQFIRYTITADGSASTLPSTHSLTQLGPKTAIFKCGSFSGNCHAVIEYDQWTAIYNNSNSSEVPDLSVTTTATDGEEIKLDTTPWLRTLIGKFVPSASGSSATDYNTWWHVRAITAGINEFATAGPRWIHFKWRGHPGMQPRDIILFTEKDGTKKYYEVESLTLDHENGGLTSEVKAVYRCAYTGS